MSDQPRVRWHTAPPGADWTDHVYAIDCRNHLDAARRGTVPFGGRVEVRPGSTPEWVEPGHWPTGEWRRPRPKDDLPF
jgi:hypothetical protein